MPYTNATFPSLYERYANYDWLIKVSRFTNVNRITVKPIESCCPFIKNNCKIETSNSLSIYLISIA